MSACSTRNCSMSGPAWLCWWAACQQIVGPAGSPTDDLILRVRQLDKSHCSGLAEETHNAAVPGCLPALPGTAR